MEGETLNVLGLVGRSLLQPLNSALLAGKQLSTICNERVWPCTDKLFMENEI